MQRVENFMRERAKNLLSDGSVNRVLGWSKGEFDYESVVRVFNRVEELDELIYNGFCAANLTKYLVQESKKEGKILVFLKPCDSYSFNQLIKEHRIKTENIYAIGVDCGGKIDLNKLRKAVGDGLLSVKESGDEVVVETLYGSKTLARNDVKLERCTHCRGKKHVAGEEFIAVNEDSRGGDRFTEVENLEKMTPDERFAFWRKELSRCIRCNACRNVCPACTCVKCVFDNPQSNIDGKANVNSFEENMFHIIRAFHVAGRCTDCGECSRVCPQGIPLHLLNRKFIKDSNALYGTYQAGEDTDSKGPLTSFKLDDKEPNTYFSNGEGK